jgi:hypothetical protein
MSGHRPSAKLGGWSKNMAGLNIESPLASGSPAYFLIEKGISDHIRNSLQVCRVGAIAGLWLEL